VPALSRPRRWSKQLTWRCFLAAAVTILVVRFSVDKCLDHGHCQYLSWASLIWFQQSFPTPYDQVRPPGQWGRQAAGRRCSATLLLAGLATPHTPHPHPLCFAFALAFRPGA
jgi:hypothetical protein